jgi:hypothetical protein
LQDEDGIIMMPIKFSKFALLSNPDDKHTTIAVMSEYPQTFDVRWAIQFWLCEPHASRLQPKQVFHLFYFTFS